MKKLLVTGLILIAARFVLPAIPGLFVKVSLNEAQGVCSSGLGIMAQGMNHTVASRCSEISTGMGVLTFLAFAGAALVIAAGVKYHRATVARQPAP